MRRTVETSRAERSRAGLAFRSAALGLAVATSAGADSSGDGPPLTPPVEMPKVVKPPAAPTSTARPKPATPPPSRSRAVLALPGITRPSVITSTPSGSGSVPVERPATPGELKLDGPLEMPLTAPGTRTELSPLGGRSTGAEPLDLLPMEESTRPFDPETPSRSTSRKPAASARPTPSPPSPVRRGRFFGLFPGAPVAPPSNRPGRSVAEGPTEDPAADSALKRRIEKQAREAVGDRARLLDVRVVGKDVAVRARGVRLFQKRSVRKSLESLPALSGLRSRIVVDD